MLRIVPKILKDHRGFTIVESVIAGAVAVVVLGGFMGSIAAMSSVQKKTDLASEAMSIETEIAETIKAGDACTAALNGKTPSVGSPANLSMQLQVGGAYQTIQEGSEPIPGVRISRLQIMVNGGVPAPSFRVPTVDLGDLTERVGAILIETERTVNGVVEKSQVTSIPLKLMLNSSNAITYCNSDANQERVCSQQGGVWNSATRSCTPTNHCEFAGSFSRAPLNQGGYNNEFTGRQQCKAGFDTVRSGSVAVAATCGKGCVANNYYDVYSCVKCGTTLSLASSGAPVGPIQSYVPGLQGEINQARSDVTGQSAEIGAVGTPAPTPRVDPNVCDATRQGMSNASGDSTCYCWDYQGYHCQWFANPTPTPAPTAAPTAAPNTCTWANNGYYRNARSYCYCEDQNTCRWVTEPAGGGCFVAGTQISMADGSKKAIEKVAVGDRVVSFNEQTGQPYNASVVNTLHHDSQLQRIYEVYTQDGHYFASNGVHIIYTVEDGDYVPMQTLYERFKAKKTVTFITERGQRQRVSAVRVRDEVVPVYNLHVDGIKEGRQFHGGGVGHNYFSGGILVHNLQNHPDKQ